jgi:hypothetical protein
VSPLGYDIPRFNNLESPIKPPLHLPLGARAYALARMKIAEFTQDIDSGEAVATAIDYA